MNTYKITNITNLVGKRDPKFNSLVNDQSDDQYKSVEFLSVDKLESVSIG